MFGFVSGAQIANITTYGSVKSLGEAMQVQMTAVSSSGQLYGDGSIVDSSSPRSA